MSIGEPKLQPSSEGLLKYPIQLDQVRASAGNRSQAGPVTELRAKTQPTAVACLHIYQTFQPSPWTVTEGFHQAIYKSEFGIPYPLSRNATGF